MNMIILFELLNVLDRTSSSDYFHSRLTHFKIFIGCCCRDSVLPPVCHSGLLAPHMGGVQNLQVRQVQFNIDLSCTCNRMSCACRRALFSRQWDIFCLRLVVAMATVDWAIKESVSVPSSSNRSSSRSSSRETGGVVYFSFAHYLLPDS